LFPFFINLLGLDFVSLGDSLNPDGSRSGELIDNDLSSAFAGVMRHVLLAWSAVSVAFIAAGLSCFHYYRRRNIVVPIIGMALLAAGMLDAFHTLAVSGLITAASSNTDLIPFSWALSRIFNGSIMLLTVLLGLWFERRAELSADLSLNVHAGGHKGLLKLFLPILLIGVCFIVFAGFAIYATLTSEALPNTFYTNALIKRPFDVLSLALFIVAATCFWVWYQKDQSIIKYALFLSFVPQVIGQLHIGIGSTALFDQHVIIAHGLKVLAYTLVLIGLLLDLLRSHESGDNQTEAGSGLSSSGDQMNRLNEGLIVGRASHWHSLAVQLPLVAFVLCLVIALLVSSSFYSESRRLVLAQEVDALADEIKLVEPLLAQLYAQSSNDVSFLSGMPAVDEILKAGVGSPVSSNEDAAVRMWKTALEKVFVEMLISKPTYAQIRFIGVADGGRELVKVSSTARGIHVTPRSRLQEKGHTRYFQDAIAHSAGEVYFSNIELNREYGEVVSPHQPVLRVATPIFDPETGQPFGVVIINVDFGLFMGSLNDSDFSELIVYIANEQGDYIHHPDKTKRFGFDLGQRFLMQEEFPELAEVFASTRPSQSYLVLENIQGQSNASLFYRLKLSPYGNKHPLVLLLQHRTQHVREELESFRNISIMLAVSLSLFALGLALFASRRVTEPLVKMTLAVQEYEVSGRLESLPTQSQSEMGVLARSFHNLMLQVNAALAAQVHSAQQEKESSEKLQAIVDSAADGIITINSAGLIQSFNTAAEQMFGFSQEELLDQPVTHLMPEHYQHQHQVAVQDYVISGKGRVIGGPGVELTGKRKSGECFPIYLALSDVLTTEGIIFTGLIRDISEQKAAEKERSQNLSLLEATLESTDNGILVTDLKGVAIRSNSRLIDMLNLNEDMLLPGNEQWRSEHLCQQLQNADEFISGIERILNSPSVKSVDILLFKDGRVIERLSMPMVLEGEAVGRVWNFCDITSIKQGEKALIEGKEAAENAARYKSEFLASMSHEIRTPMNGVLGMLGLIQRSKLDENQRHYTELARSSAESLLTIINDILDFSKVEAGKLELEELDFDLQALLGDFAESVAHRAQEKGLELILDVVQVKQSKVKGDPGRLRQILSNLVGNAIKFTHQGEITIKAQLRELDQGGWCFYCSVFDTGIGVDSDKLASLFDSFTQVDASTTREYGGSGLGLSIVQHLCQLMGGDVSVTSRPGYGSCFEFHIELQVSDQARQVMPSVDITGVPILIVDDNMTNREVLSAQLSQWGAKVTQAKDGPSALAAMEKQLQQASDPIFKVAFLDMQMPGMDGAELGHRIRLDARWAETKMVMMTSMSSRGDARYFADLGFSAYFPKPSTTKDLFMALNVVLAGGDVLDQAQPLVTRHYLHDLQVMPDVDQTVSRQGDATPVDFQFNESTRLLLVEDNYINQNVALALLEDIGLHCDVAGNGIEALAALRQAPDNAPYHLMLMDCQMPEMDGYETTRQIRAGRAGARYKGMPIVAMTANAMKGDKQKCLNAGMSDYLSKPIDPLALEQKLQEWLDKLDKQQEDSSELLIWDKEALLKRVKGKPERLEKLVELFVNDMPERLMELESAAAAGDCETCAALAHSIKGVSGNLSANVMFDLSAKMEMLAREGLKDQMVEYAVKIQKNFKELEAVLLV
jgi:PAS domain S-box-containing protein